MKKNSCSCGGKNPFMEMTLIGLYSRIWWVGCKIHGTINCGTGTKKEALYEFKEYLKLAKILTKKSLKSL
jgi:hypothetical protein